MRVAVVCNLGFILLTTTCVVVVDGSLDPFGSSRAFLRPSLVPSGGSDLEAAVVEAPPSVRNSTNDNHEAGLSHNPPGAVTPSKNPVWKRLLPPRLQKKGPKTLQKINLGRVEIYLLGTAHVSNDSSADVTELLESLRPDAIFVELCDARVALLEGSEETNDNNNDSTPVDHDTNATFWERWRRTHEAQGGESRLQALGSVLLTSVQEDYADQLGVELGGEFRRAHAYWRKHTSARGRQAHMILGDRPLSITLVRAWESLRWWPKTKVLAGLLWSCWQKPDPAEIRAWLESVLQEESDVLTESFQELRKQFPTLYTTIIEERDAWLAAKLVQSCRGLAAAPHLGRYPARITVVAIVGAGHVPGICTWLTANPTTQSPEEILAALVSTRRTLADSQVLQTYIQDVTELQDLTKTPQPPSSSSSSSRPT